MYRVSWLFFAVLFKFKLNINILKCVWLFNFFRSYELILIGGNGSLTSYAVSCVYGYQIQHTFNFIQVLGASLLSSITSCSDPPYIITSSNLQNKLVS